MKYIVKRSEWYRGKTWGSKLLREDGRKCCIGFVGQQCGISDEDLRGRGAVSFSPYESTFSPSPSFVKFPEWMRPFDSRQNSSLPIAEAYTVNDDPGISDEVREARLKEIFRSQGDEIEFID